MVAATEEAAYHLKQVLVIGACFDFAQSNKTRCVVIVSQPERGWDSVGRRPSDAQADARVDSSTHLTHEQVNCHCVCCSVLQYVAVWCNLLQ